MGAARAQWHPSPATVAATVTIGRGGTPSADKNNRAVNCVSTSPVPATTVVSSEDEDSLHSPPRRREQGVAAIQASSFTSCSAKKRKSYAVAGDQVRSGRMAGPTLWAKKDPLEYSLSPLDYLSGANADDFCHVMPHDCNLVNPLGAQTGFATPCALCSALRDWNTGEFCSWDLTLAGDISMEAEAMPTLTSSSCSFPSLEMHSTASVNNFAFTAIATAPAVSNIAVAHANTMTTTAGSPRDNTMIEATTISRNLAEVASIAASIGEDTNSLYEYNEILQLPISLSNASFPIPSEISRSTSSEALGFEISC